MKKKYVRCTCAILSVLMLGSMSLPAFAASASEKEEVVYIMTDSSGSTQSINVVNIFKNGNISDYGDYTAVKMLNTNDTINQNGDEITFTTDADRVYYQGTLENREIPWNISITYTLDGKEIAPDELGGKSGKLEIHFVVTKNERCTGSFYDDYALQAAFTLDTENCKNIAASGATIANVGANKQISYVILPGRGVDATITADVTDFEMAAVTINGVKMSLNVSIDDTSLKQQVNKIVDAAGQMNDGASALDSGAGQISDAINTLNSKTGNLSSGVSQITSGAGTLSDGLSTLSSKSAELQNGASQAFAGVCTAVQTALNSELSSAGIDAVTLTPENYTQVLADLKTTLNELKSSKGSGLLGSTVTEKADAAIQKVDELKAQLDSFATFCDGVNSYTNGVDSAASGAATLKDATASLSSGTTSLQDAISLLNSKTSELASGAKTLHNGTSSFASQTSGLDDKVDEQIQTVLDSIAGGDETVSFVSEKNTNVDSVQFVIKTAAIEKPEETSQDDDTTIQRNFWQKLLYLFGIGD